MKQKLLTIFILIISATNAWCKMIYFTPNDNWASSNAKFAAYDQTNYKWLGWLSKVEGTENLYYIEAGNITAVQFARMNPTQGELTLNWEGKWNETDVINIPTDKNYIKINTDWDKPTYTWLTYAPLHKTFTIVVQKSTGWPSEHQPRFRSWDSNGVVYWDTPTRVGDTDFYEYTYTSPRDGIIVAYTHANELWHDDQYKTVDITDFNNNSARYLISQSGAPKSVSKTTQNVSQTNIKSNWNDHATWKYSIPYEWENVLILKHITIDTEVCVQNIKFHDGTSLTLTPDATLHAQTIENNKPERLIIEDGATLTFTGTAPHATVTMNSDATHIAGVSTSWNYIAIPTKGVMPNAFFFGAWMLEWDESIGTDGKEGAAGGAWEFINPDNALGQHKGYAITQETAKTYTFQGQLVNPHSMMTLGYTDGAVCPGFNFVGNSWTSPIEIAAFKASDFTHTDATIYLFDENNAENPTAYPIGTAGNKLIAPLQGYFLRATSSGASVSYTYDRLTGRSTFIAAQPTAPQRTAPASHYETLTLRVQGEQYYDCTTLHYGAQFTDQFDQGYEALKFMGGVTAPQLYSIKGDDQMAHVAENHFTETTIGFRRGVDSIYTITFEQVPCDQDLYLQDLITGTKTRITHDASYTFQSDTSYNDIQRFRISAQQLPTSLPTIQTNTYLQGRTLHIENYQASDLQAYIIDITGRIVQQHSLDHKGTHHVSLAHLSAGTYLVRLTSDTHETTHKIIVE